MSLGQISLSLFELLNDQLGSDITPVRCSKTTLVHLSHTLEDLILKHNLPTLIFTGFQDSRYWRKETRRYRALAQVAQQVCIFAGKPLPLEDAANILQVELSPEDRLRQEWFLLILSARFSAVLCAQDRGHAAHEDGQRQFDTLWSFDPNIINRVADALQQILAAYRPDELPKFQAARQTFPATQPDLGLITHFMTELIRFEETLRQRLYYSAEGARHSAKALQESERRYRALFEQTNDAVFIMTPGGTIIEINQQATLLLRSNRETLLNTSFQALVAPQMRDDFQFVMHKMRKQQPMPIFESTLLQSDGREIAVEISAALVADSPELPSHIQCIVRDISLRKEEEEAIKIILQQLELLYSTGRALITATSPLDLLAAFIKPILRDQPTAAYLFYLHADEAGQPNLGELAAVIQTENSLPELHLGERYPLQSLISRLSVLTPNQQILTFQSDDFPVDTALEEPVATLLSGDVFKTLCVMPLITRGSQWQGLVVMGWTAPFEFDAVQLYSIIMPQVAAVAENQRLLRETQQTLAQTAALYAANRQLVEDIGKHAAELEQANKELESFSYSVSHDLRAPLRAIDGFSRILQNDYNKLAPEEAQKYLDLVRNNAQQMSDLIEDILEFSRLSRQPLKRQHTNPAELIRIALADIQPQQVDRSIRFSIDDMPEMSCDPSLMKQVYVNLLSNAVKFTVKREFAEISLGSMLRGDETIYFVSDNGVGFDMKYAARLFGVFQRLHKAGEYEGTGVGLAIVQRIIHRHGGRVWIESQPDVGTTVYFTVGG